MFFASFLLETTVRPRRWWEVKKESGSHSSPEERTGAKIGLISSGSEKLFTVLLVVTRGD